ncbi:MAG TPA: ATP-binding protein, partial [Acidimicrobiia bacterium]|nr:ATP-binding protein [Acidimicrobiia bacterium]
VGVSGILVTLARRNSSLVDRQLALLDELESREEDPETLGGYYQVDHLAARMRRNAESLLVLAGSESPRVWAKATEISDVVRAALSEVDEYQRVELLALEPARLYAGAVTDVAHLLAELFENSLQFSPPTEPVRVTGLFDIDGYELSISDHGVGISDPRLAEMNRILERPPALGLSVEPTMGIYVVAKLADRHGLNVQLIPSVPGITVKVTIPRDRLEMARVEPDYDVIDLTQPEMIETSDAVPIAVPPVPVAGVDAGDLPVRIPGRAFRDEETETRIAAAESGGTLRSALVDYNRGRAEAEAKGESDD